MPLYHETVPAPRPKIHGKQTKFAEKKFITRPGFMHSQTDTEEPMRVRAVSASLRQVRGVVEGARVKRAFDHPGGVPCGC